MFDRLHRFLGFGFLWVSTATFGWSENFVSPAEGPVPFRRDRIPLDVESMMGLGERLVVLADTLDGVDAAERRRAAQLLALSLALDPVNKGARKLLHQYESGSHRASLAPNAEELRDLLDQTRMWLTSSEVGVDGQALAACLGDVLEPDSDSEAGEWKGWIARVSEFEEVKPPDPSIEVVPEVAEVPGTQLDSASVSVPLWKRVAKSEPPQWKLGLSTLVMSGTKESVEKNEKPQFTLEIGDPEVNRKGKAEAAMLVKLLREMHGALPSGLSVKISSPEIEVAWPKSKRQSFSAAAAVLASAACTGVEPTGMIIGQIDANGGFTLSDGSWEQLRSLTPGEAPRVILPAAAAADLPSLLVMGDPGFFMDHEILLANDFKHLLKLSAKQPDEATQQVFSGFGTILSQGKGKQTGPYVAKASVRKALADLAQVAPYHASARMLAVQGAGDRPSYNTRRALVGELKIALEPMQWLVNRGDDELKEEDEKKIGETFETCRSAVEQLRRYAEKADQPAVEQALEMLTSIRALERTLRSRSGEESEIKMRVSNSYKAFLRARKEFMEKLDPVSADPEE